MFERIRPTLAALLLAVSVPAQTDDALAALKAAGAKAIAAVEKELDVKLDGVGVRFTTTEELIEIFDKELVPQFAIQFSDPDEADRQRRMFAESMAPAVMAKFDTTAKEILVEQDNIEDLADQLDIPELRTPECLQAILVHEAVHAASEAKFSWSKRLSKCRDADAILAYNAVIEGHAQHVARRICKKRGWTGAFEKFTSSVGKVPEIENAIARQLARMNAVSFSWAYHDGERFVAAIAEEGGEKAVARAYTEPPTSPSVIFHPEWFLDPSKQPKLEFDFATGLAELAKAFGADDWTESRTTLTPPQFDAAFALLPKEDVERIKKQTRSNRVLVLNWTAQPGEKLIAAGVYELDSYTEAAYFVAAEERLLRAKDEAMAKGMTRITSSTYAPLQLEGSLGTHATKKVAFPGGSVDVAVVVLARGRIAVELMVSNHDVERDRLVSLAAKLLETIETSATGADEAKEEAKPEAGK